MNTLASNDAPRKGASKRDIAKPASSQTRFFVNPIVGEPRSERADASNDVNGKMRCRQNRPTPGQGRFDAALDGLKNQRAGVRSNQPPASL
jgi:hypothetical protein